MAVPGPTVGKGIGGAVLRERDPAGRTVAEMGEGSIARAIGRGAVADAVVGHRDDRIIPRVLAERE